MRPMFTIDFARASQDEIPMLGAPWRSFLALLGALLLLTLVAWKIYAAQQSLLQQQAQLAALTRQNAIQHPVEAPKVSPEAEAKMALQRRNLRPIFIDLQRPWEALLDALAEATPSTIVLLSVAPSANKAQLAIEGEATNLSSLFDYVERLHAIPSLQHLHLKQHQQTTEGDYRPIHFQLEAEWKP